LANQLTSVAVSDFTTLPGARHRTDGDGSADEFFEDCIEAALDKAQKSKSDFLIDFDDTYGYASSFESQLAKRISEKYDHDYIAEHLQLKSDDDLSLPDRFWNEYAKDYSA
jgi:hypothetical protein